MKKLISILLCIAALAAVLPLPARAADSDKVRKIKQQAATCYQECLAAADVDSFGGTCGFMVSHQLWNLGINSWFVSEDGNQQFDFYSQMEQTSGGYYIDAYSAQDYSLIGILQELTRGGTRDVYNLLVGFQWTNTEAGAMYGHVVFVNAILDGTVYFVESFPTSIGGDEGNVIECSMMEFANFFADWTVFDGVIHFGNGQYADSCEVYGTDLFVQATSKTMLRSQPCDLEQHKCRRVRSVATGELLHATALVENELGQLFYRVEEAGGDTYVAAESCKAVRCNPEGIYTVDITAPELINHEKILTMTGEIWSKYGDLAKAEMRVTDSEGNLVLREWQNVNAASYGVNYLSEKLRFDLLEDGFYQVELYAQVACAVAEDREIQTQYGDILLWGQLVQLGGQLHLGKLHPMRQKQVQQDREGWFWENDRWYCYQDGKPLTGWTQRSGIRYYLDETGMALTGQQEVDGENRYFSDTGALLHGWFESDKGVMYLSEEGTPITGELTMFGREYVFDKKGILKKGNA